MKLLRPLSHGELYFQVPTNVFCTELGISPDITVMTQAFEDIVNQHPLLSAIINTDSANQDCFYENQWIGEIESADLSQQQSLETFLNFVANYKLDISKSLVKIWYLTGSDKQYLVIVLSHSVSDARSAAEFILLGLERYEEMMEGDVKPLSRKPLPESIETRLPSKEKCTDDYVTELRSLISAKNYRTLPVETANPGKIKHKFRCFDDQETRQILSSCKVQGLTFNNLYVSSALISLHTLINKIEPKSSSNYLYRILVDLRSRINPAVEIDCFITAASSLLSSANIENETTVLGLAQEISLSSKKETEHIANAELHQAQKVVLGSIPIPQALHLSNAGRIALRHPLPLTEPRNMLMINGNLPFKSIPLVTNTFNNRLSIDLYWAENYYATGIMEQFFNQLVQNILSIQGA